jgi:hypothetical protein
MPIDGLEIEDPDFFSGRISVLSGIEEGGLGKKWLPVPVTPKEIQAKVQTSIWDMIVNSIKRSLGL